MRGARILLMMVSALLVGTSFVPHHNYSKAKDMLFIKHDLPAEGVVLLGPMDTGSDELLEALLKAKPDVDPVAARSLTAFVVNRSARTIKAISVSFDVILADGSKRGQECGMIPLPQDLTADSPNSRPLVGIPPGGTRAFSMVPGLKDNGISGPLYDRLDRVSRGRYQSRTDELLRATELHVAIDGALFEDGEFIGPNTNHFLEMLSARARAWHDLHVEASINLSAESRGDKESHEGWARVLSFLQAAAIGPRGKMARGASENDYYEFFKRNYARTLASAAQQAPANRSAFLDAIRTEAAGKGLLPIRRRD